MKAYEIALFLIMMNASFNVVNSMGIFGDATLYYGQGIQAAIEAVAPSSGTDIGYLEIAISAIGLIIQSLIALVLIVGYSTILLPYMLFQVGLPSEYSLGISTGVWITYVMGYNQWKSGRSIMGTE